MNTIFMTHQLERAASLKATQLRKLLPPPPEVSKNMNCFVDEISSPVLDLHELSLTPQPIAAAKINLVEATLDHLFGEALNDYERRGVYPISVSVRPLLRSMKGGLGELPYTMTARVLVVMHTFL
jgi:hypothetical protein